MNKTILRLDKELSIIALSGITMLFTFISSYSPVNGLVAFLFVAIKSIIFVIIPLIFYVLEKNNLEFKKIAGIYTGYFILNLLVTIIASVSIVNGVVPKIWDFLFNLVNLAVLLSSLFILVEQILDYGEIKNKDYTNTIMKIVYIVGNFVSYPFLLFINKRSSNDNNEED